jgi:hypothetical protein
MRGTIVALLDSFFTGALTAGQDSLIPQVMSGRASLTMV